MNNSDYVSHQTTMTPIVVNIYLDNCNAIKEKHFFEQESDKIKPVF